MARKVLVLALIFVLNYSSKSDKLEETLRDFCLFKGVKYLSLINYSEKFYDYKNIFKWIRTRELKTFPIIYGYMYEDTYLIVFDEFSPMNSIMTFVTKTRRKSSILLNISSKKLTNKISEELQKLRKNSYFYLIEGENVFQIITVAPSPQVIIQKLQKSNKYYENYDLQGLVLQNIAKDFPPFFLINHCKNGKNCKTSGLLAQLQDISCGLLNCTWTTVKPQDDSWGVQQISGPFSRNGTWGGVFGGLINEGNYDNFRPG